jgi:hypothetical protein
MVPINVRQEGRKTKKWPTLLWAGVLELYINSGVDVSYYKK